MSKTNSKLAAIIGNKKLNEKLVASNSIKKPDTKNISGHAAYSQNKWYRLLSMLNTLKLTPQYYTTPSEEYKELKKVIHECASEDVYLTLQCIVYSRTLGSGMRTISHAASVLIAPYIAGKEYAKRFYSLWDKKNKKGGVIFRPDDMNEILNGFIAANNQLITTIEKDEFGNVISEKQSFNKGTKLTNAMKKGFAKSLETLDSYSLLKYKSKLIDIINLVHPNSKLSSAIVKHNSEKIKTLDAIMKGYNVSADTWEVNQGEAGQIVSKAVKEGKISKQEAETILKEAKSDNWLELLQKGKLGILAGIRNIRNILLSNPKEETIVLLEKLLSNEKLIKEGLILPFQFDIANDILMTEFSNSYSRRISLALLEGYQKAVPNLSTLMNGRNLVIIDMSGSMYQKIYTNGKRVNQSAIKKAALIAATIVKATNADIIGFGSYANKINYNPNIDLFSLAKQLNKSSFGGTNISTAFKLTAEQNILYDRIFILSDNEINNGNTYRSFKTFIVEKMNPYIYAIDLAAYGTNYIQGGKVRHYYGYSMNVFEDIKNTEFNPIDHLDKVRKIEI